MKPLAAHHLTHLPRLLSVVAASDALAAAPPGDRESLAELLIERAAQAPLTGWRRLVDCILSGSNEDPAARARLEIARRWACFDADACRRAAALPGSWIEPARLAAADTDASVRRSAATAAGALPGALFMCARLLEDPDRDVAREAERMLLHAARTASSQSGAAETARIADIIASAAASFAEHRRHGALLSAIFLITPADLSCARRGGGSALARWAAGPPDDGHAGMRSALRKTNHPLARRRAFEWLTSETMATAALDRLNRARDRDEHEAALACWPLAQHPRRRARLAMIRPRPTAPGGPLPGPQIARGLSEQARIGLARWVALVRLTESERSAMAERALADPSPRVRWAALQAAHPSDLEDFAFDADGRVARHALLRLSGAGDARAQRGDRASAALRRAQRLQRHPHASVRRLAADECARLDPWGAASPALAGAEARRLLADDPDALLTELRGRICRGSAPDRVRAIALARRLDVCAQVDEALLESVRSAGPAALAALDGAARDALERVGATAVKALGTVPTEAARDALTGALQHTSARIRANALEAMAQQARRAAAQAADVRSVLVELKADGAHRVRASAICALLRGVGPVQQFHRIYEPGAAEALSAMLGDDRPMHRIAALWAAQRLLLRSAGAGLGRQWTPLAARLADVARSDTDPRARLRAAACIRALQIEVRSGWRASATDVLSEAPAAAEEVPA